MTHDHSHHHHDHDHTRDHSDGHEMSEKEMEERMKAFQEAQQRYLQETFRWLIEFVTSYFPQDRLVVRDMDLEVHFVHEVSEGGKPVGALVYRMRKFQDKAQYFREMAQDYREGLGLKEVMFVDTESSKFEAPASLETQDPYWEMPQEKLTGKIREMREMLVAKAKLSSLRDSV